MTDATPLAFLTASSLRERRALAASTLGWMLDGMDVTLYAMVLHNGRAFSHKISGLGHGFDL